MTASHNGCELMRVCLISEVIVDVVCTTEMIEMLCLFLFLVEAHTSLHGKLKNRISSVYILSLFTVTTLEERLHNIYKNPQNSVSVFHQAKLCCISPYFFFSCRSSFLNPAATIWKRDFL